MKRYIRYLFRDKVDFGMLLLMIFFITLWFVKKDALVLLGAAGFGLVWMSGAIYRMGVFNDIIKQQRDEILGIRGEGD